MNQTVYLIDSFSLLFQVFHAIPPMTSPAGLPTNAVFGFARDLVTLLRDHKPGWLICAWDHAGPGERLQIFADYKANRTEMPEDLRPQIPLLREVIDAFQLPLIEFAGWEADDVIATLTDRAVQQGYQVRIVTSDKDARQLLGPQVQLYNLRKNSLMTEAGLLEDWGIRPDQVVDFQSLVGDAVDNVPGVPLVGPKKASQLLNQWGTLEQVLANANAVSGAKLKENLKTFADQALMSRELVRLKRDLPFAFDWDRHRAPAPDAAKLRELFQRFGFRKLIDDVRSLTGDAPPRPARTLFDMTPASASLDAPTATATDSPVAVAPARTWETIDSLGRLAELCERLKPVDRLCVDLETTHVDATRAAVVGWAISWESGHAVYLPVQGPAGSVVLENDAVVAALKPILEREDLEFVNQNIKYDLIILQRLGIRIRNLGVDPMIADYLLDAGARSHSLDTLMPKYLGRAGIPISELIGTGAKAISMAEVAVPRVAEYAAEDADSSLQLADLLKPKLEAAGLWDLYHNLERPLIHVLANMEQRGIRVDAEEFRRQSTTVASELERLVSEIHGIAGREFNIASPVQLRTILFEELQLPVIKRTKTGPSTDEDVLEELAPLHPLPAKIIEHRQLAKLKGTYLDALPQLIHPETGRIHASFHQAVAATGRLSSSDPNLQNIPIRTQAGRLVRKAFIPGQEDWVLICADYSQIELRMLAHFSQDAELMQAFASGQDIHTAVAAEVFQVTPEQVDADQRRVAKAVNFGVIYGQSPFGLATALGISKDDAATFIEGYFTQYAGVARFMEQVLEQCRRDGSVSTILGRRRAIEGVRGGRIQHLNMPERTAVNSVIQGSAADLIKRAMVNVEDRIAREKHPGRLLLQIHDELVLEAPRSEAPGLIQLVSEEMERAMSLDVPLVVDVSLGENWLDQRPWGLE